MLKKCLAVFFIMMSVSVTVFAENMKIKISATDWAPYTGETLPNGGFFTEICQEAFVKAGYVTEVTFIPWKRAVEKTKRGRYDLLIGASYTEERSEYFSYPKHYWESSVHFFALKGNKFNYRKIEDLCPAKLGIFLGSFYVDRFKHYKCFTIETVPTTQLNIKKLAAKRIDLFIDAKDSVFFYLNKRFPDLADDIEPLYPPLETDKIYMVVSKKIINFKKIIDDFDKGVMVIKNDGTYDKILKKHGLY